MAIADKNQITGKEVRQYCTGLRPGDVGEYVLLPGDPARCDRVAKYLDNAELVMNVREHRTITGYYKGLKISTTSTGMGCPSAAIATEELANIGAKVFIRIGSTAALKEGIHVGDLIVSTGAMKNEGTSKFFVPESFPAVPDFDLTTLLLSQARSFADETGTHIHYGIGSTDDSFFGETPEFIEKVRSYGCINLEMEGSGIFTVAMRKGCRAAAIYGVSSNLCCDEVYYGDGRTESDNELLAQAWEKEIQIVLETMYQWSLRNK